jgi:hypothetical protein
MLELSKFKAVLENTPLVSIDLCFIFEGQILLGKRNNDPLKTSGLHLADEYTKTRP